MGIRYDDILMTIDVRKGRLRIYKSTLHRLNDPKAIQLLVNPASKVIAIRPKMFILENVPGIEGKRGHNILHNALIFC